MATTMLLNKQRPSFAMFISDVEGKGTPDEASVPDGRDGPSVVARGDHGCCSEADGDEVATSGRGDTKGCVDSENMYSETGDLDGCDCDCSASAADGCNNVVLATGGRAGSGDGSDVEYS